MRFRFSETTNNSRYKNTGRFSAGVTKTKFAWFPARIRNGTWIWLERYRVIRVDL